MFGLGMPEILLILAIALIVIGPGKLPELAKTMGRAMGEFKRAAQDLKASMDMEDSSSAPAATLPEASSVQDKKFHQDNWENLTPCEQKNPVSQSSVESGDAKGSSSEKNIQAG